MKFRKKYGYILLVIVMLCTLINVSFGASPSVIKVGLISVYNNASSISLTSDEPMMIGHYDEGGFTQVGALSSGNITIKKASSQYYDLGKNYSDYQSALAGTQSQGGTPVYVEDGLYTGYSKVDNGNCVSSSTTRYVVLDATGNEILVFNKAESDLVFRGYDRGSGLNLTGVGANKKYRGAIGIGGSTGITPYNIVDLTSYLYGVLPGEMAPSWPEEALKAQAVAARSIAIYQYARYTNYGYNVVDTTATQVYGGYTKEDRRTNAVVDATKGETVNYNGKVAEALYFSTSGGATESAVNVWGNNTDYLVGVPDAYETEPEQPAWTRHMTLSEVDQCLAKQGVNIGKTQGAQIVSRTTTGRVNEIKVIGTNGSHSVTLEAIRTFFGSTSEGTLKSRLFSFTGAISGGKGAVESTPKAVSVLSATGSATVSTRDLVATNGVTTAPLGASMVAESGGATTVIQGTGQAVSGGNSNLQLETIWGDFTIYGQGFGHGVGMSQSGAKGMAKAGFDYVSILKHYYTGVTVG